MPIRYSHAEITRACLYVANSYDLFNGNCGRFAFALHHVLGGGDVVAACDGELSFAHCAWRHPDGSLFDGSGATSKRSLLSFSSLGTAEIITVDSYEKMEQSTNPPPEQRTKPNFNPECHKTPNNAIPHLYQAAHAA